MDDFRTNAAQDEHEISAFVDLLKREGVKSYLEVGSKFGGSLWRVGSALPKGAKIVSIDMPNGTRLWSESHASLSNCISELKVMGHDARVIWADSTSPEAVSSARDFGPYDCVFIDGDHRLPGLTRDWENYGPMGRMVAFHDITWHRQPEWKGVRIDVPKFWTSIKDEYRHEEFRFCYTKKNNGIGVLWTR